MTKIVAISDTHNRHNKITIPECDILIHAGDWSFRGEKSEVENFSKWMNKQTQAKNIVLIPGNHELFLEQYMPDSLKWFTDNCPRAHLLIDQSVTIDGIKIYGTPVTPFFHDWAWNRNPSEFDKRQYLGNEKEKLVKSIKPHWDMIPDDTNILITHGPPFGILDQVLNSSGHSNPPHLGCELLMIRIKEVKPDLHFFGHIHSSCGQQVHRDGTSFYNASICDEQYLPSNPITVVEYER